ncbi:enoyl-CoA hydratase family protein [Williamsia deligens]|uniref:Enoyl-CoA hydratase family protein n=1 Tax=Williamsia deligens TaxID=321325 RepID=A0ABW3G756_9NOCA|nr:enoyl-CoA hydratase family protein [Williamsia deligens]MCP2194663.1 enoyl-CoA hydratase [Williamsia deligens]
MADTTSDTVVTRSDSGGVATITLDSPANRNALSPALTGQLRDHLAAVDGDTSVRSVVLTHTGGTFCAGADLSAAMTSGLSPEEASAAGTEAMTAILRAIITSSKPVIARIDGHVRAGGLGIVGACDIVVVGPSTTFALTEARLGLAPSMISLTLLPKMDSRAASRYFLTGEKFGPAQAQEMGLVTIAVDDADAVGETVAGLTANIAKASPQGLRESKKVVNTVTRELFDRLADQRRDESAALFASDEAREGMTAFLQRREPSWVSGSGVSA